MTKAIRKKLLSILVLTMSLSVVLIGCGSKNDKEPDKVVVDKEKDEPAEEDQVEEVPAWEPSKNIDWIVTSGAGGGSDIYTRVISDIMKSKGFVDGTFLINNQTDGGGEVGRLQVSQAKSDGHMLLTFNSGDLMPMVLNTGNRIENFRPVALMAVDRQLLLKGTKTPYADFNEAIEAAKSGTQVVIGGSRGDDLATYEMMLESVGLTDVEVAYMMFDATSDALTSLLGGHVDFAISKPAASLQYLESGDMTPVVALAKEHFSGSLASTPLLSEIGDYEDVESPVWRGVVAPASTPDEAIEYWSEVFRKVSESDEWKTNYLEKNMLSSMFMPHDEAKAYMEDYEKTVLKNK